MKTIMTVCGPIPAHEIGRTSMHDHILADLTFFKNKITDEIEAKSPIDLHSDVEMKNLCYLRNGWASYCEDNWRLTDVEHMTQEVQYFKDRGGSTILEPSAPGIRCQTDQLKRISEATHVNIVASTGLYREETWPMRLKQMDSRAIQAHLRDEIHHGIDGTDIKAGHIKAAVANGSETEFGFLRDLVPVANETGLMVTAHTSYVVPIETRRKMLQTLLQAKMNMAKLLFCHIQYTFVTQSLHSFLQRPQLCELDLRWTRDVLDTGASVCIDLFGFPQDNDQAGCFGRADAVKMSALIELIQAGYTQQIVIGNDVYQKIMTRTYGGHGYARILDYVIPVLKNHGIDQNTIDQITTHNPARLLEH